MLEFENKVAVVAGGGGGIGKAVAARLLEEGASVVLSGRRQDVLEAAKRSLDPDGRRIAVVAGDVSAPAVAAGVIGEALNRFGGVDVLINSTGVFRVVPFLEQTEAQLEEALDTTLRPTFYMSQAAARAMVERGRGGAIVSVGSMWAIDAIGTTPTSAYSAAQAGRHALTKNLAIELAPHGIRVNTVALAFVETPAYERFMTAEQAREVLDSVNGFHPLGRHGYADDVVGAILFLASGRADWITGTTLPIDGGVLAGRNAPPATVAEPVAA
jgi:NAD(P)-dependent dehydrogenase (short-subunit alcohol dehydrogenase family)